MTDGDTRQLLLKAALSMVEQGTHPAQLSLRQIARQAGLSHAAPYKHFKNREDILVAMAVDGFQSMMEACVNAHRDAPSDPLSRFMAIGVTYLSFAWKNPGIFRVMFDPAITQHEHVQSAQAAVFSLTVMSIAAAQREALVRPGDPQEVAMVAWSGVHGFATLHLGGLVNWVGLADDDHLAMARRFTRMVYDGMRP